ncbi:AB hydrolase superfamily protein [Pleurotus pulmonarius]
MRTSIPLLAFLSLAVAQAPAPIIDVGNAKYQGIVSAATNISNYYGIRYAAAPVGDLRFRAPQDPPALAGVQKATVKQQQCLQGRGGGEDCLFLNVHFPGSTVPTCLLPVVVWIHGGGYLIGGAASWNGGDLISEAKNGVVAVIIQYRLGVFGFLAGSQVKANGALNAGLREYSPATTYHS